MSIKKLVKDTMILAIGVGGAKIIAIIFMPLLTRLYEPMDFGLLSVFISYVSIISPFLTLRYVISINLPKQNKIANDIILGCVLLGGIITVIMYIFAFIFESLITDYVNSEMLYIIPISAYLLSLFEVYGSWMVREGKYKTFSVVNTFQSLIGVFAKISFFYIATGASGLIIGQFIHQLSGVLPFFKKIYELIFVINIKRMFFLAKYYFDFVIYRLPSQVLMVISMQIPILYFSFHYSKGEVGQLGLAIMMLSVPIQIFGNTTGKVYYSAASKLGRRQPEEILNLTKGLLKKLIIVALPVGMFLFIYSEFIFEVAFGTQWRLAGEYAQYLSLYLIPQFLSAPIINVLNVFLKQKINLTLNITRFLICILSFFISWFYSLGSISSILVYSIFNCFYYTGVIFIIFMVIKNEVNNKKCNY